MSAVTVYGLRVRGEREVRYIGFTCGDLNKRLKRHLSDKIYEASWRPMLPWIRANGASVEIFAIAKCNTVSEARATESVLIALCLRLNQRLLNGSQVPRHLRLVS